MFVLTEKQYVDIVGTIRILLDHTDSVADCTSEALELASFERGSIERRVKAITDHKAWLEKIQSALDNAREVQGYDRVMDEIFLTLDSSGTSLQDFEPVLAN